MKAIWNNQVVAESDDTVIVEGNHYFPRAAISNDLLTRARPTRLPWERHRALLHLAVAGETNADASGTTRIRNPRPGIEGRVAFWHGVRSPPDRPRIGRS